MVLSLVFSKCHCFWTSASSSFLSYFSFRLVRFLIGIYIHDVIIASLNILIPFYTRFSSICFLPPFLLSCLQHLLHFLFLRLNLFHLLISPPSSPPLPPSALPSHFLIPLSFSLLSTLSPSLPFFTIFFFIPLPLPPLTAQHLYLSLFFSIPPSPFLSTSFIVISFPYLSWTPTLFLSAYFLPSLFLKLPPTNSLSLSFD